MATKIQELKFKLFQKKYSTIFMWGLRRGYIYPYRTEFIDKLRDVYYNSIPASILLLTKGKCYERCYDMALLLSHVFKEENYILVDAVIDSINLPPQNIDQCMKNPDMQEPGMHRFLESVDKDGKALVYDTNRGMVFEKNIYYLLERPRIKKIYTSNEKLEYLFEKNKEGNDLMTQYYLGEVEDMVPDTFFYHQERLKKEIEIFKEKMDYHYDSRFSLPYLSNDKIKRFSKQIL